LTFARRHDRYVLGVYWASFGAVLLFFTSIVVVMDLAERLQRIVNDWSTLVDQGHAPGWLLLEFYGSFLPFILLKILPVSVPIAAAFALRRLSRRNELAPLVTAGVSTRRIVLPLVLSAVAVSAVMFAVRDLAAPSLGRRQMALSRLLTKRNKADRVTRVPHMDDAAGVRITMDAYWPGERRMEGVILTVRGADRRPHEARQYPVLTWDEDRRAWVAPRGGFRFDLVGSAAGLRRPLTPGEAAPIRADAPLVEVTVTERATLGLSLAESRALVRADPENARLVIQHHKQFTEPLSAVVLLLLALPFLIPLDGRNALRAIGASLVGGGLYFAAALVTPGMGASGALNPVVVAWTPTVLFGSMGLALTLTMRS
jgi:lipopolysaccharide export system permease protein